jgi:hypothetical protein
MKASVISRASLAACVVAIVIGIYQSEHAYDLLSRQEWFPEEPPWAGLPLTDTNKQFFNFMGSITNSSMSSASELSSALARIGSHIDINQFQMWLSGVYYSRLSFSSDPNRIGLSLAKKGVTAKHPVIIIPGATHLPASLPASRDKCFGHELRK